MEMGELIKKARKEKGFTQAELAKAIGVTQSTIGKYESGDRKPAYDTLHAISRALLVPTSALIPKDDWLNDSVKNSELGMYEEYFGLTPFIVSHFGFRIDADPEEVSVSRKRAHYYLAGNGMRLKISYEDLMSINDNTVDYLEYQFNKLIKRLTEENK